MLARVDFRSEQGITIFELLIVMFMMAILMAATTSMFVDGSRAQAFMSKQLQAQDTMHTAVDKLRKDVNMACLSTATQATATSSITLSEPDLTTYTTSPCDGNSTITWCTSGSGTSYSLYRRTSGATCTAGILLASNLTSGNIFTYYGQNYNAGSYAVPFLHLDFTINAAPTTTNTGYHEIDDLAMRDGVRQ